MARDGGRLLFTDGRCATPLRLCLGFPPGCAGGCYARPGGCREGRVSRSPSGAPPQPWERPRPERGWRGERRPQRGLFSGTRPGSSTAPRAGSSPRSGWGGGTRWGRRGSRRPPGRGGRWKLRGGSDTAATRPPAAALPSRGAGSAPAPGAVRGEGEGPGLRSSGERRLLGVRALTTHSSSVLHSEGFGVVFFIHKHKTWKLFLCKWKQTPGRPLHTRN